MRRFGVLWAVVWLELASAADVTAQSAGKWTKLAPFPEPAEELYGVAAGGTL